MRHSKCQINQFEFTGEQNWQMAVWSSNEKRASVNLISASATACSAKAKEGSFHEQPVRFRQSLLAMSLYSASASADRTAKSSFRNVGQITSRSMARRAENNQVNELLSTS